MEDFSQEGYLNMQLLRFTTCGSVDDGKSTLIGRLLYDSKSIFEDQMETLKAQSKLRGDGQVDLAHLTDGLRSEREQGITIDVAYRYFATPKRKFIIADTPGHIQYTRNMVTGASTADLAIILIDAREGHGVMEQSKRHAFIASLLGIPHLMVCVNKMDLIDYSEDRFNEIVKDFKVFSEKLNIPDIHFTPISALTGANVVDASKEMPWHSGPTVLGHLENVHIASDKNLVDFRLPVQYVIRPDLNFRGYAGRVASGVLRKGDAITVLPSGKTSTVKDIVTLNGSLDEAFASQSVTVTLNDEIDISRGDMIVRSGNQPQLASAVDAHVSWMSEDALNPSKTYIIRQGPRELRARIAKLQYKIDMETLHRVDTNELALNDIGKISLRTSEKIAFDPYKINRKTGNFIIIDPDTNITVGAGMIDGETLSDVPKDKIEARSSENVTWFQGNVTRVEREARNEHPGAVLWLTGLSASGKSTIASALEKKLFDFGYRTYLLDGDNVRHGLCGDLGFSEEDRRENIRRVGEVAKLFFDSGKVVICPFISPYAKDRDFARSILPEGKFKEIYVKCSIATCKDRDPKGLYEKALSGEILDFTGISSPYEEPQNADLVVESATASLDSIVDQLFELVKTIKD